MFLTKDPGHGRVRSRLLILPFTVLLLVSSQSFSFAGSATWKLNPTSGDWNTAANWTPSTVPNSSTDTATFDVSSRSNLSLSASVKLDGITFDPGASAFSITVSPNFLLTLEGLGIMNNSGATQNFVVANFGTLYFDNSATAGSQTFFINTGGTVGSGGGTIVFLGKSSAGTGVFINEAGRASGRGGGGSMQFAGRSTAGNGTFIINGGSVYGAAPGNIEFGGGLSGSGDRTAGNGIFTLNGGEVRGALGGQVSFYFSSGGNATFTVNGGLVEGASPGLLFFAFGSTAENATLIAKVGLNGGRGGDIRFTDESRGGNARVELFGDGDLDISYHYAPGITIGSIEGSGVVFLGANNLSVGSRNLSTNFSGVIQDGGGYGGGTGGSLTKIGRGKLVLQHGNTYTGGTTVQSGKLVVNNRGESGTGTGPVQVEGGKLGGKGMIAGAVTIGRGSGAGAVLAPGYLHGVGRPGALTIQSPLAFRSDGTYQMELNSSNVTADEVIANGVTINAGAQFSFLDFGSASLPQGTVFSAINNTAANPIAGAFVNLPDGSTFTNNGNTYKVNYKGGDGNDLILTVVP